MRIPEIAHLQLPDNYPGQELMNFMGQIRQDYAPHTWTYGYAIRGRYLSGLEDDELQVRYSAILRSMRSYLRPERDFIPINNYRSSWYWLRKEYQTRLEFALRGIELPLPTHVDQGANEPGPSYMQTVDGKSVMFRYNELKYLRDMVERGIIRFAPATAYEDETQNAARQDDELERKSYLFDTPVTLIVQEGDLKGTRIDLHAERLERTVPASLYHLVCFSCVLDQAL